jgi:hypothetical protein
MMVTNEPVGCGIEMESSSMSNCVMSNISTQDTYGPGIRVRGQNMFIRGDISEPAGGRLNQFALGFQGTRTRSNSAIEMVQATNCQIEMSMAAVNRSLAPYIVDFNGSANFDNKIIVSYNRRQASPWWNTSTPIRTAAGYNNAKCYNRVETNDGIILHGAVTQSRLTDATDNVNTYKGFGYKVPVTDGTNGREATRLANGTWEMTDKTILTPV